ncbi:hypothetical protein HQ36_06090 [Porphyromonas gingivicanis]|uniref:DUF4924 domain-containing protein n=1 Tax=Porphyromonas gingivicanis TaxID=266762 RepID=A0A0A2G2H2_9PORP|nr:DUF4924 family protein [Porphyromonas gingivicanis]KGN97468.1 hypothetical protein HQ36_06090 [Porphyromonas gingivicanis]
MDNQLFSQPIMQKLRDENPAEYLLYIWKLEELVRAFPSQETFQEYCNGLLTDKENVPLVTLLRKVYAELQEEELLEKMGTHSQDIRCLIKTLEDLHLRLLEDEREEIYQGLHLQVLPSIIALQKKNGAQAKGEIETCLEAIYGLHRLQSTQKEVFPDTLEMLKKFGLLLKVLGEKRMTYKESE